jgi:hypothetical protein
LSECKGPAQKKECIARGANEKRHTVTLKLLEPVSTWGTRLYIADRRDPGSIMTASDMKLFPASLSGRGRSVYRKRAEPVNTTQLHRVSPRNKLETLPGWRQQSLGQRIWRKRGRPRKIKTRWEYMYYLDSLYHSQYSSRQVIALRRSQCGLIACISNSATSLESNETSGNKRTKESRNAPRLEPRNTHNLTGQGQSSRVSDPLRRSAAPYKFPTQENQPHKA